MQPGLRDLGVERFPGKFVSLIRVISAIRGSLSRLPTEHTEGLKQGPEEIGHKKHKKRKKDFQRT
jgi:hypothetical protein